jgi:hypothetical protein
MPTYKTQGDFLIYRGRKIAEAKYRKELSKRILEKFARPPYDQNKITEILTFCLDYYISEFENICRNEHSYTFYKNIFWFHEQATEVIYKNLDEEKLPKEISGNYIAAYRRILKFIIEMGCEVKMVSGEEINEAYRVRAELLMDDLFFLGEMIMTCVDLYAEQRMIDDVAEISFNKEDLYVFTRKHHYEFIFSHISKEFGRQITKHIVDPKGFPDFTNALLNCFNIKYEDVSHLIASIQKELNLNHGDTVAVGWETFIQNMHGLFSIPVPIAEQFFEGLKLDSNNKMCLKDLACRPYNLNRFIYRPIVIWNIDQKDYGVFGSNGWTEAFIQLTTNAIPWGKAPKEWVANRSFKQYVHRKEDEHDKWLDDEAELKINSISLMYDRNVRRINTNSITHNIDVEGLGEIDFIIVSEIQKKIFIADCKHLLGRYDMVNQKNDFNAFVVGSNKTKSYNETITNKLLWFNQNIRALEEHFQLKYNKPTLSFADFTIEGIFIVNSPTFYMYNADYRIYTIDQLTDVLLNKFVDPKFMVVIEEEDTEKILNVKYPFFKKPKYVYFDPEYDEEDVEE